MRRIDDFLVAKAAMLIRRPVAEVFEAFVNPVMTSRFWFSQSSGRVEVSQELRWGWEMSDFSVQVKVKAVEERSNSRGVVDQRRADADRVGLHFSAGWDDLCQRDQQRLPGTRAQAMQRALEATEDFAFVLAGAKAFLERHIELGLVRDCFPDARPAAASKRFAEASAFRIRGPAQTAGGLAAPV